MGAKLRCLIYECNLSNDLSGVLRAVGTNRGGNTSGVAQRTLRFKGFEHFLTDELVHAALGLLLRDS